MCETRSKEFDPRTEDEWGRCSRLHAKVPEPARKSPTAIDPFPMRERYFTSNHA